MELQLYEREGLDIAKLTFQDNQGCVDVLEKKPNGIFPLLEDELTVPAGSDKGYIAKLHKAQEGSTQFFEKPRMAGKLEFTVKHYAQPVVYTANGFLEKNRNRTGEDVLQAFRSSSISLIQTLFSMDPENGPHDELAHVDLNQFKDHKDHKGGSTRARSGSRGGGKNNMSASATSVGATFQSSLKSLLTSIRSTKSHFVRCIKPNVLKKSELFTDDLVMRQLVTSGVLDAVTIRQLGYADRFTREDFIKRYAPLLLATQKDQKEKKMFNPKKMNASEMDTYIKTIVEPLALQVQPDKSQGPLVWQMGKTRIFMKHNIFTVLEEKRYALRLRAAVRLQAIVRGCLCRWFYKKLKGVWHRIGEEVKKQDVAAIERALMEGEDLGLGPVQMKWAQSELRRLEFEIKHKTALLLSSTNKVSSLKEFLTVLAEEITAAKLMQTSCLCSLPFQNLFRDLSTIHNSLSELLEQIIHSVILAKQKTGVSIELRERIEKLEKEISGIINDNWRNWQITEFQSKDLIGTTANQLSHYIEVEKTMKQLTKIEEVGNHLNEALNRGMSAKTKDAILSAISGLQKAIEKAQKADLTRPQVEQSRQCLVALHLTLEILAALEAHPPSLSLLNNAQNKLSQVKGETLDEYLSQTPLVSVESARERVNVLATHLKTSQRLTQGLRQATQQNELEVFKSIVDETESFLSHSSSELAQFDHSLRQVLDNAKESLTKLTSVAEARALCKRALAVTAVGSGATVSETSALGQTGAAALLIASARSQDQYLSADQKEVKNEEELLKEALHAATKASLPKNEIEAVERRLEGVKCTRELNDAIETNQLERLEKIFKKAEKAMKKNKMDVTSTRLSDSLSTCRHRVKVLTVVKKLDEAAGRSIPTEPVHTQRQLDEIQSLINEALVVGAKESDLTFSQKRLGKIQALRDRQKETEEMKKKLMEEEAKEKKEKEEERQRLLEEQEKKKKETEEREKKRKEEDKKRKEEEKKNKEEDERIKMEAEKVKKKQQEQQRKEAAEKAAAEKIVKEKMEKEEAEKRERAQKELEQKKMDAAFAKKRETKTENYNDVPRVSESQTKNSSEFKINVLPPTLPKGGITATEMKELRQKFDEEEKLANMIPELSSRASTSKGDDDDDDELTDTDEETDTDDEFSPYVRQAKKDALLIQQEKEAKAAIRRSMSQNRFSPLSQSKTPFPSSPTAGVPSSPSNFGQDIKTPLPPKKTPVKKENALRRVQSADGGLQPLKIPARQQQPQPQPQQPLSPQTHRKDSIDHLSVPDFHLRPSPSSPYHNGNNNDVLSASARRPDGLDFVPRDSHQKNNYTNNQYDIDNTPVNDRILQAAVQAANQQNKKCIVM